MSKCWPVVFGGKGSGSYPFGWSKEGPVEREQAVLSVIKTLLTNGDGFARIARYLNSRPGHQPRRGERWTRQTVVAVASKAALLPSKSGGDVKIAWRPPIQRPGSGAQQAGPDHERCVRRGGTRHARCQRDLRRAVESRLA
jgi:hypothetical protein